MCRLWFFTCYHSSRSGHLRISYYKRNNQAPIPDNVTPPDLFFVLCLFGFLSWLSPPISERRTYKVARQTKAKQVKRTKAKKPKKQKRTKARKEKRYKPPGLSVEQQLLDTRYVLGRDFKTYHNEYIQN